MGGNYKKDATLQIQRIRFRATQNVTRSHVQRNNKREVTLVRVRGHLKGETKGVCVERSSKEPGGSAHMTPCTIRVEANIKSGGACAWFLVMVEARGSTRVVEVRSGGGGRGDGGGGRGAAAAFVHQLSPASRAAGVCDSCSAGRAGQHLKCSTNTSFF